MGALNGLDSDVWVTASPSIALAALEVAVNYDSGAFKVYRPETHLYWDKTAAAPVIQSGVNAKQQIAITGSPTGGTFTLTFGGNTTTALNWNATAAQVDAALGLLASVGGAANVNTSGGPLPATPIIVEFARAKGGAPQALITHTDSLTGGSSPAVAITSTQTGIAWATLSPTLYTFQYVGGLITFTVARGATETIAVVSGTFFNVAQLASCKEWTLDLKSTVIDTTIFQQSGWGASQAAMSTASGKVSSFIGDGTLDTQLANLMVFVLYLQKTTGLRFECYAWLSDDDIKTSMAGVVTKDVSFVVDGQVYLLTQP